MSEPRDLSTMDAVMVYFVFDDLEKHQGRWECFDLEGNADGADEEYEEILYRVYGGRPLTVQQVYRPHDLHVKYMEFLKAKETQPWIVYEG